ncbi:MAG TPA: hypothetical protein ENJ93_04785 [Chloroflexi bacterium]|nr:hypothetical protein [Chloroflexota bacterium]
MNLNRSHLKPAALPREKLLALAILLTAACAVIWVVRPVWNSQALNDDSFITLTYAKNLAAGQGFVYNHPPATLGSTTPLFVFSTALLTKLAPAFTAVEAAIILSALSWAGAGLVLYLIMRRAGFRPVPAAVAAAAPLLLGQGWQNFIGMEIWPFQFLLTLSVLFAIKGKPLYAGLLTGLLFLTRGEGALLGLILFGYFTFSDHIPGVNQSQTSLGQPRLNWRDGLTFAAGAGVVVAVWAFYALVTFGTIIPNTLAAKQAQAQLSSGKNFLEQIMLTLLPNYVKSFGLFGVWFLNPYLILAGIGIFYAWRKAAVLLIFGVWGIAYLTGYAILNPSLYYWYVLHLVFVLSVFAGIGLAGLFTAAMESAAKSRRIVGYATAVIMAAALFSFSMSFLTKIPAFPGDRRAPTYTAVSSWLKENSSPEESVAFIEIGYLGYYTDNRIVDMAGLVDPTVTEHIATDGFTWAFWHYEPDYYIYIEEFNWALGDIKPALDADYSPVHSVEREDADTPIYIYKRNN